MQNYNNLWFVNTYPYNFFVSGQWQGSVGELPADTCLEELWPMCWWPTAETTFAGTNTGPWLVDITQYWYLIGWLNTILISDWLTWYNTDLWLVDLIQYWSLIGWHNYTIVESGQRLCSLMMVSFACSNWTQLLPRILTSELTDRNRDLFRSD